MTRSERTLMSLRARFFVCLNQDGQDGQDGASQECGEKA